jgi:hypothetical protein
MNLATLVQHQTLATLLQALSPASGLVAGATVEARLLAIAMDGTATAQIGDARIALVLAGPQARDAALQPGATLLLKLLAPEQAGAPVRATLLEVRPATSQSQLSQAASPQAAMQVPGRADATSAAASPPASAQLPADLVRSSAAPAQPAQTLPATAGGTAGLAASQAATTARADRASRAAAAMTVAIPLEAGNAQFAGRQAAVPAFSPRSAAGPMLGPALANQDGIAPLLANLRALQAGGSAALMPAKVLRQVGQILAQALPVERRPVTPQALRQAVAQSGLFMEAHQAAGQPPAPQRDLKAGLVALREALAPLLERLGPAAQPAARPEVAPSQTTAAPRPAPPRRDGPLTPQPIAEPTLGASEPPLRIAETLLRQTEAAIDRIALSQFASLPAETSRADQGPVQRWVTEIPLAFQSGTAMLPLKVEREPARREAGAGEGTLWRVRFALDVEPMGPLQGVVTLQGRRVGVTLWAERDDISRLLRGAAPGLEAALLDASFEQGAIDIHTGQPPVIQPTAGQFLDRMS